jgi:hypothetical protein
MDHAIDTYCPSCFAMPGERCRSKYLILNEDEVLPVVCPTHSARLVVSERQSLRQALARMICAAALQRL